MKGISLLATVSVGLMAAAACASSEAEPLRPDSDAGLEPSPLSDAGTDADAHSTPPIRDASTCSKAGWCMTTLPDRNLVLRDIWPLETRAFAIAESHALGVKVLEWEDEAQTWNYIDDNTQNEYGLGRFAGKLWAPTDNELYYTTSPGMVYRGVRASPSSPWSWQREQLEDNSRDTDPARDHGLAYYSMGRGQLDVTFGVRPAAIPALGVWGTSVDDVYAWYANTVFRRQQLDGQPAWVPEYVVDDADSPDDTTYVFSASGSGPDDVWFASGRIRYGSTSGPGGVRTDYACPVVIHKTAEGYQRLVDSVIAGTAFSRFDACGPKSGTLSFEGSQYFPFDIPGFIDAGVHAFPWTEHGLVTNITSAGPNAIIGVFDGAVEGLAYVTSEGGGLARRNPINNLTFTRHENEVGPLRLHSVWLHEADAWISGWGLLLQLDNKPQAWRIGLGLSTSTGGAPSDSDPEAGTYRVSTAVLDGAPVDAPLYQVRGTSNTNLWAIGADHALHKTTP